MKKKYLSHVKRHYKRYVWLIIALLLLLTISGWLFVRHYKPLLSERLKKQVYLATDSLYRVTFSEVHLNPVLGQFTLDSFHLIPDTNTYNRLKQEHRAPPNLFDVSVGEFQLRRMNLWSLVFNKKVKVGIVKAENPDVIIYHEQIPEGTSKENIRQALFDLTAGPLGSIQIDHIGLHNISLLYKNRLKPEAGDIELKNMELVFRDIRIDSSTLKDSTRFLFAKDIWFHLDRSLFYTADSLYKISTKGIGFSVMEEKMLIKDLKITPRLNEREFDQLQTYRKNLFAFSADSLLLEGLTLEELQKKKWYVEKISLLHSNADIYLNRGLAIKPVEKPLLRDALKKITTNILIDTLRLKNVNIKYREFNPNSGRIGYVTFNNIHGDIRNVTNDSIRLQKNKFCKADLNALFMNHGKLHALFSFDLTDPDNIFSYSGHLGFLSATVLNPATRPLGLVKIKSGRIHSLDYDFNADNSGAYGSIALKYDRLGISVLSKNETGDLKKKGLISLAANLLLLKDNNLHDSLAIQQTKVAHKRDPYRSIFNLMWKSIFSGVKVIVGVDKKTEENIKSLKKTGERLREGKDRDGKDKEGNFLKRAQQFLKEKLGKDDNSGDK